MTYAYRKHTIYVLTINKEHMTYTKAKLYIMLRHAVKQGLGGIWIGDKFLGVEEVQAILATK